MGSFDRLTRREFLKVGAAGAALLPGAAAILAACTKSGGGAASLNALFMQQAAYSNTDVQGMIQAFHKANDSISVSPTFVAYEALHDKIVTAAPAGTFDVVLIDVIWPPEFATKHEVVDVTDRYPSSWTSEIFPGALDTSRYRDSFYGVPWILDTKYLFYNKDARAGRLRLRPHDVGRRREGGERSEVQGGRPVPVHLELGAGRGGDL